LGKSPQARSSEDHPLGAEGGLPFRHEPAKDSLQRFFELMEFVETLHPEWPPRELAQDLGAFLLSGKIPMPPSDDGSPAQASLFGAAPLKPTDRLFLGLFPDASAIAQIDALGAQVLQRHGLRAPRHKPERLHITLFHIGDWAGLPADTVEAARVAAAAVQAAPFEICLDQVASFSGKPDQRPLVLKAAQGNQALHAFRDSLGRELARIGLGRCVSRTFEPHVTLAYAPAMIAAEPVAPVRWTAQEFVLVHSLLGQTRYIRLGEWPLAAAPAHAAGQP
jgi:RNA 2',3'-cyclic 3'-phosphodiesterase